MPKFDIAARYAWLARPFQSTEEGRPYLNGFFVQPGPGGEGAVIVATDAKVIGIFFDSSGHVDEPGIIGLNTLTFIACEPKPRGPDCRLRMDGDDIAKVVRPLASGDRFMFSQGDAVAADVGQYPDWKFVVPTWPPISVPAGISADLLRPFEHVARDAHPTVPALKIMGAAKEGGAIVVLCGRKDFYGAIMPCRWTTADDQARPEWLDAVMAPGF